MRDEVLFCWRLCPRMDALMTLALSLLLKAAARMLDELCLVRLSRDVGVLTPEYLDPGLAPALEGEPCPAEALLRAQLRALGAQMRAIGRAAMVETLWATPLPERRRAALLALLDGDAWQRIPAAPAPGIELHWRPAADGCVYLLAAEAAGDAAHAPHAMRDYTERLWVLPAGSPLDALPELAPCLHASASLDSLSIDAALRDLSLHLQAEGAPALARQVEAQQGGAPLLITQQARATAPLPAAAA